MKGKRSTLLWAGMAVTTLVIAMQFAGPHVVNPPATGEINAPDSIKAIVQRACYDCHSNATTLQWYDKLAPIRWLVATHVNEARQHLNFSHWDSLPYPAQVGKLWYMVNMIDQGKMPLASYTATHPSAKVSEREIDMLKKYVIALSSKHASAPPASAQVPVILAAANPPKTPTRVALNGIAYLDDYKTWKVMAATNRFDNNTMRVIYGNDIAITALKENNINPWPNGARIAKVVWDISPPDDQGNVTPGAFNNIQLMIRDDQKYAHTDGWGYARFSTRELIPYGKTKTFDLECSSCHRLAASNGFVFDIPTQQQQP
jgi:hypothetical protein